MRALFSSYQACLVRYSVEPVSWLLAFAPDHVFAIILVVIAVRCYCLFVCLFVCCGCCGSCVRYCCCCSSSPYMLHVAFLSRSTMPKTARGGVACIDPLRNFKPMAAATTQHHQHRPNNQQPTDPPTTAEAHQEPGKDRRQED